MKKETIRIVFFKIGVEIFLMVVIGLGIGAALDHFFLIKPWGLVIGFVVGIAAGFRALYRLVFSGEFS